MPHPTASDFKARFSSEIVGQLTCFPLCFSDSDEEEVIFTDR